MSTKYLSKEAALAARKWFVVDAAGLTVGRLASEVASIIRGKHKPTFTKHVDGGDFVIIVNAEKIQFTGKKLTQKKYYRHTGYIGGIKEITAEKQFQKDPTKILYNAIKGMLPRGALGHQMIKKLKVYAGESHPHTAQQPEVLKPAYATQIN